MMIGVERALDPGDTPGAPTLDSSPGVMPPGASCAGLPAVASIAATLDLGSPRALRGTEATPRSGPSTPRPCTRGPLTRDVERVGEPRSQVAWWLDQMGCNGFALDASP